jgi:hypothetical protein
MHRISRVLACAVLVALVAACSSDDDGGDGAAGPTGGTSPTAGAPTDMPTNGVTGTPGTAATEFATDDRLIPPPDHTITLKKVTTERDGSIERVVIDVSGAVTPGVETRYVDVVRIEDEPVMTEGSAALELVLEAADPTGTLGMSQDVTVDVTPNYPIIKHVLWARYLAGTVVFAIGVSDQVPYRVLTDESKVVIEFQG